MGIRNRFPTAIFIPFLLAVLSGPAWAGPPGGKASHYPGQDCSGCHKVRGKSTGKAPVKSIPANTKPAKAAPAKGATQSR